MGALKIPRRGFWSGKRVFITGHTGFKGGWLSLWLHELGAILAGYALTPDTTPNLFTEAGIEALLEHQVGDIRDAAHLTAAMQKFQPDITFHLAAQPLVRASYARPMETFATNIMGTAHLLDAVRQTPSVTTALIITSDKVYAEAAGRHDEAARLGGHNPYSASKACAELITAAFPMPPGQNIATLRSGNVIGGGDWATDRLVPDFIRTIFAGEPLRIRNPHAIRPWQHVLDPLCGYLIAAEYLWNKTKPQRASWNFGPNPASEVPVVELAAKLCQLWGAGAAFRIDPPAHAPHEAPILRLNAAKARTELGWQPSWDLDQALAATTAWFQNFQAGANMSEFTKSQIEAYSAS